MITRQYFSQKLPNKEIEIYIAVRFSWMHKLAMSYNSSLLTASKGKLIIYLPSLCDIGLIVSAWKELQKYIIFLYKQMAFYHLNLSLGVDISLNV